MCGSGTFIGDGKQDITVEEVQDAWSDITSLEDIKPLHHVNDSFAYLAKIFQ